ncbi:transporter substrate-binding domain-containing protein [Rhizobium sp. XQZ8]|uniref:transporter substrate-binding domain-containing protein n=1 Tax=Rhizobium populisoli TaxID=2859785 RepID=UPI001CA4E80B|nr:transporter substrate-binding domain-containing protein [Rhizobium populisoli]MBW6423308.1 transporter substrate-binding domain-containing protein [Rhizobium populisoli]
MRFAWIAEPPFNFRKGSSLTGCDVELARYVFSLLGETFEPVETEFGDLLDGLADERWDVATGMFLTPERMTRAPFTISIWSLRDGLLVQRAEAGTISGYRDIARNGFKLAVLEGQLQHRTALDLGVPDADIVVMRNYEDAAQAVATGTVLAYASVELAHLAHIEHNGALACVPVPLEERPPEEGGFACRNAAIRDRLNSVLADFIGGNEHAALLRSFNLDPEAFRLASR